ncbi:LysR family transcriptional regulator [Nocardioides ultimimeridianus]
MGDLHLWRTFLAIHRQGSISAAARSLGLAQPSVTAQLQTLERRLGEALFERHARGVLPTPRADELAAHFAGPFDALAAASAVAVGDDDTPPVRVGGPAEFLAEVALPALAGEVAAGLHLRVVSGLTDDLLADLRAGRLDVVVSTRRPKGRSLRAVPLADEEFVLVGPAGSALRPVAGPDELSGVPLIAYALDVPILRRYWRHVFERRLDVAPAVTVADLRAVRAAVAAGAGVSVLPRYLVQEMLDAGTLVELVATDDPPLNTTFAVTRATAAPGVLRVVEALRVATAHWR